jgi:hypothetical protein
MDEIKDRRPPWVERTDGTQPPFKVGQTIEVRYADEFEQSFIVKERHFGSPMWAFTKNPDDMENDIIAYRIVCDETGRPILCA